MGEIKSMKIFKSIISFFREVFKAYREFEHRNKIFKNYKYRKSLFNNCVARIYCHKPAFGIKAYTVEVNDLTQQQAEILQTVLTEIIFKAETLKP